MIQWMLEIWSLVPLPSFPSHESSIPRYSEHGIAADSLRQTVLYDLTPLQESQKRPQAIFRKHSTCSLIFVSQKKKSHTAGSVTITLAFSVVTVMPKSRNLPITTRKPISDAKAREFLLVSSSWGSHCYWRSGYREEPRVLDYIAYIGSIHGKKRISRYGDVWLVTFFWRIVFDSWLVPIV